VPPLGLAYVAAVARREGLEVRVLDGALRRWPPARIRDEIRAWRPDVLGVSVVTPLVEDARALIAEVRASAGRVIVGGPHPSAADTVLDEIPGADLAVVGEGEHTLLDAMGWSAGDPPPGVRSRGRSFTPRPPIQDLDALPWPARDLLESGSYRYPLAGTRRFASLLTSRGCPYTCTFCDRSVHGRTWRARSAASVLDEWASLVQDGARFVVVWDDGFLEDRDRAAAIAEGLLARNLNVTWKCEARVDQVDPEILRLLRRAGCRIIAFGVESASPRTLRSLGKGTTPERAARAFTLAHDAGIETLAYAILGAPGEDLGDVAATVRFCRDLRADWVQFSTLAALPGTPFWPPRGGTAPGPLDAETRRLTVTDLPSDQLEDALGSAWRGFYARPSTLVRVIPRVVRSGCVREVVGAALRLTR